MTKIQSVRAVAEAVVGFYFGAKGLPSIPLRILRALFSCLSTETQLYVARDVTIGMTAACLEAKERWGEAGNVVVDGNFVRVGRGSGPAFVGLGCGRSWAAAFADAESRFGKYGRRREED